MRPTPGLRSISPVNSRPAPDSPAAQESPSRARRSSNSCRTLSRGIGRPLGDQPVGGLDVGSCGECLAKRAVAEHLCQLREELEVRLVGVLRHEHREHQVHGLAVGRLEGDRRRGAYERAHRLLQRLDAAVRYCNTVSQPRGAQLLAIEERVEYPRAGNLPRVLEEQADLLEQALLAAHVEVEQDVVERQQSRHQVHRGGILFQLVGLRDPLDRLGMARLEALLVLQHLAVELVDEHVDGGVHVRVARLHVDVLAGEVHVRLDPLVELFHRHDHVHVDHVVEMPVDSRELVRDVVAVGCGVFDVVSGKVTVHLVLLLAACGRPCQIDLRRLAGWMCIASRYLATVLRATWMPCWARMSEMRWSESGFLPSSAATSCLISARMAVAEQAPPVSVETWLPKKYLSSKMPRGVSMYFCVVTREIVESCRPTASAISRSTSGRMATSPCSKKFFWRSTIDCVTRRIVSKRCWTFLMSQRASCSCPARCLPPFSREACRMSAYILLMRRRAIASRLSDAPQRPPTFRTTTSGTT